MTTASRFRRYQDVAAVEHDDRTRQPKPGGRVWRGCVVLAFDAYVQVRTVDGKNLIFSPQDGWAMWAGKYRWRLVPLCRCESPILGESVKDPDDPRGEEFCGPDCLTTASEASHGAFQ